jgi:hypothetical protein
MSEEKDEYESSTISKSKLGRSIVKRGRTWIDCLSVAPLKDLSTPSVKVMAQTR